MTNRHTLYPDTPEPEQSHKQQPICTGKRDEAGLQECSKEKKEVTKAKTKLKGQPVYISDELTPYRNNQAYLAWQAVKNKVIKQTWAYKVVHLKDW